MEPIKSKNFGLKGGELDATKHVERARRMEIYHQFLQNRLSTNGKAKQDRKKQD